MLDLASNGGNQKRLKSDNEGRGLRRETKMDEVRRDLWFKPPPKVKLTVGILGPNSYSETRGTHTKGGERGFRVT